MSEEECKESCGCGAACKEGSIENHRIVGNNELLHACFVHWPRIEKKNKDNPLTVKVTNGELRISIGISTLKFAAENSPDPRLSILDHNTDEYICYDIIDEEEFAKDVATELKHEEEDGTTLVHTLLDNAIYSAIESGSLGVAEKMKKSKYY